MSYRFPIRLNFSETPFVYGIYTESRGFCFKEQIWSYQTTQQLLPDWMNKWRIKINQSKTAHITFTPCNQTCPTVQMGNADLP
jgi:hypothetical protein